MTTVRIPRGIPRAQYTADGTRTVFTFPFPIFSADDLDVWIDTAPVATGFTVSGAGRTEGGEVTFDRAPDRGDVVLLSRRVPIERVVDFSESGPLSAGSLNTQLDKLTACLQQTAADQERMLRYLDNDLPASGILPTRSERAGRVLAFDEAGAPTTVAPVDEEALSTFPPALPGGVSRTIRGKLADWVSVKDFGAAGDGVSDDTDALRTALASGRPVLVPGGVYRVDDTLVVPEGGTLAGMGQGSVIASSSTSYDLIQIPSGYATVSGLRLEGGRAAIRLLGRDGPCVHNKLADLTIWEPETGIVFDGYETPDRPCYWNALSDILIARPSLHGVRFMVSGAGDTPNANRLFRVRVYSLSAPMVGSGFYVEAGRYNNSFVDCEANLWPGATACFRVGPKTDKNLIVNFYAETLGGVPNIQLDAGSVETSIINLFSASAGPAIWDKSGGAYTAFNAGYPEKNRLALTRVSELVVEALRFDTEYIEPLSGGLVNADLSSSVQLVSAWGGPVEFRLPAAGDANGHIVTIKKTDASANPVKVTEAGGPGPDSRVVTLTDRFDLVTVVSNGAGWWITAQTNPPGNTLFHETPGVVSIDPLRSLHLVSAFSGAVEARLPVPWAVDAGGRTVTIKKSDQSSHVVTVTRADGGGPDNEAIPLTAFGHAITVMSNGSGWHILGRNP